MTKQNEITEDTKFWSVVSFDGQLTPVAFPTYEKAKQYAEHFVKSYGIAAIIMVADEVIKPIKKEYPIVSEKLTNKSHATYHRHFFKNKTLET